MRQSIRKPMKLAILSAVVLSLVACGAATDRDDTTEEQGMSPNAVKRLDISSSRNWKGYRDFGLLGSERRDIAPWQYQADGGGMRENTRLVGVHSNSHVQIGRAIAKRLEMLNEVKEANVVVTDRNAYVALVLHSEKAIKPHGLSTRSNFDGDRFVEIDTHSYGGSRLDWGENDLDRDFKESILRTVQALSPRTSHVFVTANTEQVEQMKKMINKLETGTPARSVIQEWNEMVDRMFPADPKAFDNDLTPGLQADRSDWES